jgi:hypothetical protein
MYFKLQRHSISLSIVHHHYSSNESNKGVNDQCSIMYSRSQNFQLPHATLCLTDQLEVAEANELIACEEENLHQISSKLFVVKNSNESSATRRSSTAIIAHRPRPLAYFILLFCCELTG